MHPTVFELAALRPPEAIDVIRHGLPLETFKGIAEALSISREKLALVVGVHERTLRNQRRNGRLSPEQSERLLRTARLLSLARSLFSTDEATRQWFVAPAASLQGQAPLDLMDIDIGGREVEDVLRGIMYGNVL